MGKGSYEFKIVLFGAGSVGKSAIAMRFVKDVFPTRYEPTIEENFRKIIKINGKNCVLEIFDTAGTEQFKQLQDIYIKEGHAFLLVYSIISTSTFAELQNYYNHIKEVKSDDPNCKFETVPICILGNKCDLANERTVEKSKAEKFAADNNCKYLETSAKTEINIDEAFETVINELIPTVKEPKSCVFL